MQLLHPSINVFPHPNLASKSGVLAVGGEISAERLLLAYNYGIFPWYNEDEPIIWWCPKPRFVIFPDEVKIAKSMRSYFNQQRYQVTYNCAFEDVINHCMDVKRNLQKGTWINSDIISGYIKLHEIGYATSVEVWEGNEMIGGLYGVNIGKVFFGESMFSLKANASKYGFIKLAQKLSLEGYKVIDCQQPNPYLESLGGRFISGYLFDEILLNNRLKYLQDSVIE